MNILCVVAHPDDEVLGCGGTLAKHAEAGDRVNVAILVERSVILPQGGASLAFASSARAACETLGLDATLQDGLPNPQGCGYPDQRLDTFALKQLVGTIDVMRKVKNPDIVYTHNPSDLNLDHELTARAVLTAFRPCHSQATILAFETLSSTEWSPEPFHPNYWVALTIDHVDKKTRALDCYPMEKRDPPHPRNTQGVYTQARWRGAQCGHEYAEAFRLLRGIA